MNGVDSKSNVEAKSSKRMKRGDPVLNTSRNGVANHNLESTNTMISATPAGATTEPATVEATDDVVTENRVMRKKYPPTGPNKCANLQGNTKTMVKVNACGQPKCKNARKLSSYLGLLSRDPKLIPFDLEDWRKFLDEQTGETLWKIILTRFTFESPTCPKDWAMDKLNHCLRSWSVKLKKKHYKEPKQENMSLEEILKQPDCRVDPDQWQKMVYKWESPEGQACSERNEKNCSSSKMAHHLGSKSFARLRDEETKDGEEPGEMELFEIAYGQPKDKPVDPDSSKKIADMKNKREWNWKMSLQSKQKKERNWKKQRKVKKREEKLCKMNFMN